MHSMIDCSIVHAETILSQYDRDLGIDLVIVFASLRLCFQVVHNSFIYGGVLSLKQNI